MELTTVTDTSAVLHDGLEVVRLQGLRPDAEQRFRDIRFRTLPRPAGGLLATIATANDLHLGEVECGRHGRLDMGPVLSTEPGDEPYPQLMSRAVAGEIAAAAPDAVVVKGDITAAGSDDQAREFLDSWGRLFGHRLHHIRGNHDVAAGAGELLKTPPVTSLDLDGVRLVLLDTSVAGRPGGALGADQVEELDQLAAESDRPVLVFGHHHPWDPGSAERELDYFGVNPDDSEALVDVVARRRRIAGYLSGHTHRNRVRRFRSTGDVPWVEVGAAKDYPGGWAEYRVYEDGILQLFHRASAPEALAWTDRTRAMFAGLYPAYSFGSLEDRCFAISVIRP